MSHNARPERPHVALLSPFFYPEPISTGKANTSLAAALLAHGCDLTVICSHPLYPDWVPVRTAESLPGMTILRGGARMRYSRKTVLRRLALEFWFMFHALRHLRRSGDQFDVILSVWPPSFFTGLAHRMVPRRVRRVALIHDLQGVYAQKRQGIVSRYMTRIIHAIERHALSESDVCIFFSNDLARQAQSDYRLPADKLRVQYPYVTLPPQPHTGNQLEAILPSGRRAVVYAGALGHKQNSELLLEFLEEACRRIPEADFHIFSGGPVFDSLRKKHSGTGIAFHPLVEEADLAELYARSDLQIIPQLPGSETGSIPSKLPNLIAAGVHILAVCPPESEVCRILAETQTATFVPRWEREIFIEGVRNALGIVEQEPPSVRRERAATILSSFKSDNLVKLVLES